MAASHVALLRGVNLAGNKPVAMADLRALVEGLGYREVRTLLNSGNVAFTVPGSARGEPAARLEHGIATKLGVRCLVVVLTAAELAAIVRENPLGAVADNPSRLLVTVLAAAAERKPLVPLTKRDWTPEAFALGKRTAWLWCAGGIGDSPLAKAAGKALGPAGTSRNWATIQKLHALTRD